MNSIKKRIPLTILTEVSEILASNLEYIKLLDAPEFMLSIVDSDQASEFYFRVKQSSSGDVLLYIRPCDTNVAAAWSGGIKVPLVPRYLRNWIEHIKLYNEMNTIFDDPIQKKYEEDYFNEFSVIDDDAEYAPFDIPKQFIIANHIQAVKTFLVENQADFKNDELVQKLTIECEKLIEELPHTTKNTVVMRMASIWASISKSGMSLMKKFLTEFGTSITKQIATSSAETLGEFVKGFLENPPS